MKRPQPTRNLPQQLSLPYPEITCPECSGRMEFESYRPQEVVPSCTTLVCKSCRSKEDIFFDYTPQPLTEEICPHCEGSGTFSERFLCPSCNGSGTLIHEFYKPKK